MNAALIKVLSPGCDYHSKNSIFSLPFLQVIILCPTKYMQWAASRKFHIQRWDIYLRLFAITMLKWLPTIFFRNFFYVFDYINRGTLMAYTCYHFPMNYIIVPACEWYALLQMNRTRAKTWYYSCIFATANIWKELPLDILLAATPEYFKTSLRTCLF